MRDSDHAPTLFDARQPAKAVGPLAYAHLLATTATHLRTLHYGYDLTTRECYRVAQRPQPAAARTGEKAAETARLAAQGSVICMNVVSRSEWFEMVQRSSETFTHLLATPRERLRCLHLNFLALLLAHVLRAATRWA